MPSFSSRWVAFLDRVSAKLGLGKAWLVPRRLREGAAGGEKPGRRDRNLGAPCRCISFQTLQLEPSALGIVVVWFGRRRLSTVNLPESANRLSRIGWSSIS